MLLTNVVFRAVLRAIRLGILWLLLMTLAHAQHAAGNPATPEWKPINRLILAGGDYLPPRVRRGCFSQNWVEGRSETRNLGVIATLRLTQRWSLVAGLFRSVADNPVSYDDLYVSALPTGVADHVMVASPDQSVTSTFGATRLTGCFAIGNWRIELAMVIRGRAAMSLPSRSVRGEA
jgi:hypothetical protein